MRHGQYEVPHNQWRVQTRTTKHTISIMGTAPINKATTPMTTDDDQLTIQWGIQHKIQGPKEQLAEAIHKGTAHSSQRRLLPRPARSGSMDNQRI